MCTFLADSESPEFATIQTGQNVMVNKVILVGNLGAEPEKRALEGGRAVARMSVATSFKWRDDDGNQQERTEWHRVVVWGPLAEIVSAHLVKGSQVYVEGRLSTTKWRDKDGNDRYTTEIVGETVKFLGKKPDEQPDTGGQRDNRGRDSRHGGGR